MRPRSKDGLRGLLAEQERRLVALSTAVNTLGEDLARERYHNKLVQCSLLMHAGGTVKVTAEVENAVAMKMHLLDIHIEEEDGYTLMELVEVPDELS